MKYKKLTQIIILVGIILSIPFINIIFEVKADILSQNPTSNSGLWILGSNAYSSDNNYAVCSKNGDTHKYYDYDFDSVIPDNTSICSVEIGLEHYETASYQGIQVRVTWDNENTWSNWALVSSTTECFDLLDASTVTNWTRTKLLDANFKVQVKYLGSGGGCYPENTYILTVNSSGYLLQNAKEIKIGQEILCWNKEENFTTKEVLSIDTHFGNWDLYDIYSGEIQFLSHNINWTKHISLTSDHSLFNPITNKTQSVKDFKIGDIINHLHKSKLISLNISDIKISQYEGYAYNVRVSEGNYIFAKSFSDNELSILEDIKVNWRTIENFDLIMMAIKIPYTAYLDWIPVKVGYCITDAVEPITDYSVIFLIIGLSIGLCIMVGVKIR